MSAKERPILFSGPMVRAILEGRKTQTRRVVKPMAFIDFPTGWRLLKQYPDIPHHPKCSWVQAKMMCDCQAIYEPWKAGRVAACPYGKVGDRLWVREAWSAQHEEVCYKERCGNWLVPAPEENLPALRKYYDTQRGEFRPSIHMPRWASRITLEVVGVRVERLQEISPADACAEGAAEILSRDNNDPLKQAAYARGTWGPHGDDFEEGEMYAGAVHAFAALWESIHGPGSWEVNPWVWVVEFRVVPVGSV
jgi:hypothetical protein